MTTPSPDQQFEAYVPVYDMVPDKWEDARQFLVEHLKKISNAVNVRTIGWMLDEELLSGQQLFPSTVTPPLASPSQFRSILRKVIDFEDLPDNTTKTVPHGIVFDSNFTLVHFYGASTDPVNLNAIPIPYTSNPTAGESIRLDMDDTDVIIRTTFDYSRFTRTIVTIEYTQEI